MNIVSICEYLRVRARVCVRGMCVCECMLVCVVVQAF